MRVQLPLVLFLGCSFAGAQAVVPTTNPAGLLKTRVQGIEIPNVSGAPFTAKEVVTWVQPLVGGGTATRTYYTLIARDSQGRVHQEFRSFVSASSTAAPPLVSIIITDPVTATRTTCTQSTLTCTTAAYHPIAPVADAAGTEVTAGSLPATAGTVSRVSLGADTIDQLPVVGTRETSLTVTGDNAASRLVVSNRDLWYSPDLQMDLSVVHITPQLGQLTLNITELVQGDPDPSWFVIPTGYQAPSFTN